MPSAAKLSCVDPAKVALIWPHARTLIRKAIFRTGLSHFADVEADVLAGRQLLWLAFVDHAVAAAATTLITKPNGRKVCTLVACGGSGLKDWLPLFAEIEDFARAEGCAEMRIGGRKGWERVLNGYRAKYVTMTKEL